MTALRRLRSLGRVLGTAQVLLRPGTGLIVPVLAAEPAVASWLGRAHVEFDGAPLHVTLMFPFLPARGIAAHEHAIAEFAADIEPFEFALARVGGFPGVHYLAPEPADRFVDIIERVTARWPGCLPYGGAFESIVPHMTVAFGERPPADPADLTARLPITTKASELWLIEQTTRGWRTRSTFPFGSA